MSEITDTEDTGSKDPWQRLYHLSPYCEWAAGRYGCESALPVGRGVEALSEALEGLWQARVEAEPSLVEASDSDRLSTQQLVVRQFRHQHMLQILKGSADGSLELSAGLLELSNLAKACVRVALAWSETAIAKRFGEAVDANGEPVRLMVIGMGKLGGDELNVSSDIDLIFAYRANGETTGPKVIETSEWCRRVAQRATQVLHAITEDSFAYRVDTRLRPFGESGPLVMSFDGMEHYYLTQGRNWERYAMVKAAVIAGDERDATEWQQMISPFVYRRYLDYSTIESLADLKQKINTNLQSKAVQKNDQNWNVKLGHGGIREIEFIVQSFQLVRGGRDQELQGRSLLPMLSALEKKGLITADDEVLLGDAYRFLRRTENALQAMRDQQVHSLPESDEDKQRLLGWMGFEDWEAFDASLQAHRAVVTARFDEVFKSPETTDEPSAIPSRDLSEHGIEASETVLANLEELTEGSLYQRLTANAQQRIDRIVPLMVSLCAKETDPNESLLRCLALVRVVAGRSGYLQVLLEQPVALERLVNLLSRSRWITDFITKHPIVIDELLMHSSSDEFPDREELLDRAMTEAKRVSDEDLDVQMDAMRQFQKAHECRVAVAELSDDLPLMKVSDQLTWLAESVLAAGMHLVTETLEAAHGRAQFVVDGETHQASVGVIAYGKLGGLELAHGSDLDVVFLHDSHGEKQNTDGERSIANAQFYARLAQRVVSFMTTLTPAGTLYEMDLRLRPNGSSGVLVTGIDAFETYQSENAWTWEHQALTRARMVFGPESLESDERIWDPNRYRQERPIQQKPPSI